MQIKIGADPELFLQNPNSGEFVSAHGLVPGTKRKPHKVPLGAVQLDGTAAEFNIDPALSMQEFSRNINAVMTHLQGMVPGYNLSPTPAVFYDQAYFDQQVPSSAKELGCDPDFSGWTMCENPRPNAATNLRTGAGHIHIGWTEKAKVWDEHHYMKCAAMARQMDYYLGIWSLLWDKDPTRRSLYGKAGAFRPKPYGMEYRVMSNSWLSSEILIRWVYNAAHAGATAFFDGGVAELFHDDLAKTIIDNNETDWTSKYDLSDIAVPPLPAKFYAKVA